MSDTAMISFGNKKIPSIRGLDLRGQKVFMRLDLNVPMKGGEITSDARIRAALPTIRYALEQDAIVALASHLGRPKGKKDPQYSLEPVGARLSELLDMDVFFAHECKGDGVRGLLHEMRGGQLMLMENLRFEPGETKNDGAFARALAEPFDVYINDAFGASHREHASIVGMVPHFGGNHGAGFLLEKEMVELGKLLNNPKRPVVAVVGGAKVADKIGVLSALLPKVNTLCIGGAMTYTFLQAVGEKVGASLVEKEKLDDAKNLMLKAESRGVRVVLPVDHVMGEASILKEGGTFADCKPLLSTEVTIPPPYMGLDIGHETASRIAEHIANAETVFWNGPMGVFEVEAFSHGTFAVAKAVAECKGHTVVGGGDSVAAIEAAGVTDKIDHVSTGGGASLELLEHGSLPGIDILSVEE